MKLLALPSGLTPRVRRAWARGLCLGLGLGPLLLALGTGQAGAAENLVRNGGFEAWSAGQASDWLTTTQPASYTQLASGAHGGASGARVTPQATYGGLRQSAVPVLAGATYKLTCWLRGGGTGTDDTVRLLIVDWTGGAPTFKQSDTTLQGGLSPDQWRAYQLVFTTGAQTQAVDVELGAYQDPTANPIVFLADDVRLEWVSGGTPAPTPAPTQTPPPKATPLMIAHGLVDKRPQPEGADRNADLRIDAADVVSASNGQTSGTPQLANGGLENWQGNLPTGWSATDAACELAPSSVCLAGTRAALMQPQAIYGGLTQRGVAVEPWTHYRFSIALRAAEASPNLFLRLLAIDRDPSGPRHTFREVGAREGLDATQWQTFSLEFWSGPSTSWVDLEVCAAQYPDAGAVQFLADAARLEKIGTWPLAELDPAHEVNAIDFGAYPSDGRDDTAALNAAIAQLNPQTSPTLVLPPGRYDLSADHAADAVSLHLQGLSGINVRGYGAALMGSGLTRPLLAENCADLTIQGLTIDWDRPPYSVGEVLSAEAQSFRIRVFDEFPVAGGEPVMAIWEFDPATQRPPWNCLSLYNQVASTQRVAPQVLQVNLAAPATITPGRWLNLRHQVYGYDAFKFLNCQRVTLRDTTVLSCPGMVTLAEDCDDLHVQNLHARVRPHSQRLMSATADGIHAMNCAGTVTIEDSSFEGTGDDAANIHGMYLIVDRKLSASAVLAHHARGYSNVPRAGDVVEFSPANSLLTYTSRTVSTVRLDVEPGLHGINFTGALPAELAEGDILGNVSRAPVTRILRNRVLTNRGRGFLASTRDLLIEDNLFEYCTAGALLISPEIASFNESIGVRQVRIRNNRSHDTNYGTGSCEADYQVSCYLADWNQAAAGANRDVILQNNTTERTANAAFYIGATAGAQLLGNTIRGCSDHPNRGEGSSGILLRNASSVRLQGNQLLNPGAAMSKALDQTNASGVTLSGNTGF